MSISWSSFVKPRILRTTLCAPSQPTSHATDDLLDDLPPTDVAHDLDGDAIRGLREAVQLGPELDLRALGFEVHLENALMVVLLEHHNVGLCGRVVCDQF